MNDLSVPIEGETGLALLRELIARGAGSPMAEALNMRLIGAEEGAATFEAFPSARFYNPQGRVHGGYAATLIDSALGCAVQTRFPAAAAFGTIELKVNYVRKLTAEAGRLLCTGQVIHAGRTLCTAEARVVDEQGKLYAHGSGTFLVYPK